MGCYFSLQGIFPTQGSNLFSCIGRWFLYHKTAREALNNIQFSSVTQSSPTLCDPMNCSMPGLPVHHQLPEFTQTHVRWVSDAIQPSHPPPPNHLILPPGSSGHGIFQARILEWVAIHFSRGSSRPRDWTRVSCVSCITVQVSPSVVSDSLRPHGLQHPRLPCPSPTPRACSNSCPLSQWCHPTISSSVIPFFSCPQSFPASGSFPNKS